MRFLKVLAATALAGGLVLTGWPLSPAVPAQAASCSSIKAEFKRRVRPQMLRLSKQNFYYANWYQATLKRTQSGSHPTLSDINSTHRAMLKNCETRTNRAQCRRFARNMTAASKRIYRINRRWSAAGCPGRLDR
jgi:hypothetical protein